MKFGAHRLWVVEDTSLASCMYWIGGIYEWCSYCRTPLSAPAATGLVWCGSDPNLSEAALGAATWANSEQLSTCSIDHCSTLIIWQWLKMKGCHNVGEKGWVCTNFHFVIWCTCTLLPLPPPLSTFFPPSLPLFTFMLWSNLHSSCPLSLWWVMHGLKDLQYLNLESNKRLTGQVLYIRNDCMLCVQRPRCLYCLCL